MLAKTFSATHRGIEGLPVEVEAIQEKAIPSIHITGLPGEIVKESRERIRGCLLAHGFEVPSTRLVIHLSPASAKKQGSHFDLGIAVAILAAEGFLNEQRGQIARSAFLGELSMDGRVLPVHGIISLLDALEKSEEVDKIFISSGNRSEAQLLNFSKVLFVNRFCDLVEHLRGITPITSHPSEAAKDAPPLLKHPNLDDVRGQRAGKRGLQISLAGKHHLLMVGPPGVGKSLLANCSRQLLPPAAPTEWIEILKNFVRHPLATPKMKCRPFRAPHHTISGAGMLGGGSGFVIPGEVSLAHRGVLFLDEFPEFRKDILEGLREPLENGCIHLHRVNEATTLSAEFTLIAAMNPCPCGYHSRPNCRCAPSQISKYQQRISGPILDRFDLYLSLGPPSNDPTPKGFSHEEVWESIERVHSLQAARFGPGIKNGDISDPAEYPCFRLGENETQWLNRLTAEGHSYRAMNKILKVARTVADLEGVEEISLAHLREAKTFRCYPFTPIPYALSI